MPVIITRKNTGEPHVPYAQQPIPKVRNDNILGQWYKEAIRCTDCGWTGTAKLNSYWTIGKFSCPECRGPLELDQ